MEYKITKKPNTSMEEAQKSGIKHKQQKIAINLGKGGIGIGVGIILVGGALTTAALVANAFQKKKSKPSCKKNNNKTPADKFSEKNDTDDQTYDFQSNLPGIHSSPYLHQHLISDGTDTASESGDSRGISAQNLLPDVKHKFEGSDGKEDLKCNDDQEIASCSKDSEKQSMECNGFVVETDELSSSTITDSLLHQSTASSMEDISCIAMELPERIDGIEKTNADQGTEESHQPKQSKIEEQEENCCTYSPETGEANIAMLSSIEEISDLIDHDQEINGNADTALPCISIQDLDNSSLNIEEKMKIDHEAAATETGGPSSITLMIEEDSKRGQDDDLLALVSTEDSKINEITEAADEDDRKSNTTIFMSENEEKVCNHSDGSLTITDQGDEDKISGAIQMCEGKGINDCQVDVPLTTAAAEVWETVESLKVPKGEKQPETPEVIENKIHAQIVETEEAVEEREAQDEEVLIDTTGSEIDSSSEQTSKLNECQATVDQDSNHVLLTTADAGVLDAVELLKAPKTENQTNEAEEEVEEKETQHDVQTDAAAGGQVILDQGCNHELLDTADAGVFDADELLEAPKTEIQPETPRVETKEGQYDFQINAAGEVIEEEKDRHGTQINAADEAIEDKEAEHYSCCNKEKEKEEVQHDVQINAAGEAAEINSGSEQTSKLNELQKVLNQDYSDISHKMTSENILPQENEQYMSQLNPVMGLKGESKDGAIDLHSSKINTEFISSEPAADVVNGDNPLVQSAVEAQLIHQKTEKSMQEFQDKSPTSGAADTIIEDHLVKSITRETIEGGSGAGNVEKVGESSEGSVDSLVESTSEPVLPAETVQEVPMQVTKEIQIKDQKEKLQENGESATLQKLDKEVYYKKVEDGVKSLKIVNDEKESSNMTFLKKYMVKLAEQNDEQKGILMRNRAPIAIGTMSALLCPLCNWYFGIPFVKICLIAVLVMVLSKIQGF